MKLTILFRVARLYLVNLTIQNCNHLPHISHIAFLSILSPRNSEFHILLYFQLTQDAASNVICVFLVCVCTKKRKKTCYLTIANYNNLGTDWGRLLFYLIFTTIIIRTNYAYTALCSLQALCSHQLVHLVLVAIWITIKICLENSIKTCKNIFFLWRTHGSMEE